MLVKHISKGTPHSLNFQKSPLSDFIWRGTSRLCLLGHKIITNHYGIFWPREWPFIKLKHVKVGKPDTQENYSSKGEGTPAIP